MNKLVAAIIVLFSVCVCRPGHAQDSQWITLFDGKSMDGWKANERASSWALKDGTLITQGDRCHLFYVGDVANHDFKNFELVAEVYTHPGSNSGIYVHTKYQETGWPEAGYELQVCNSNRPGENYQEHKMTGSVYAVRNTWVAPVKDNEWFEYRIVVKGKTLQTFINGKLICEYTENDRPFRANDKKGRLLSSGTIALQAHDPKSIVQYRNIRIKLLPANATSTAEPITDPELETLVGRLSDNNTPLIDLGIVAKDTPSFETTLRDARKYGLTLGIAVPIESISQFSKSVIIFNDRMTPPSTDALKAAKASGYKIAFSSGGDSSIDPDRLKNRLKAISEAQLGWQDFWIPGKDLWSK